MLQVISEIIELINEIQPFDALEAEQIADTITWIKSVDHVFRIQKPDIPNKHLVSYFLLFDENAKKVLLVDHKKAQLWLPSGGHVEIAEHPLETVKRECIEELGIEADFWHEKPLFLTSTLTANDFNNHTDVSLWYVLKGNVKNHYYFDTNEFYGIQWFDFEEIPYHKADPHMIRFIQKLKIMLQQRNPLFAI